MKKLSGSRPANVIVVLAIAIVPLLYAGLLTLAYQNPTNRLSDIKAAVVNEDSSYTGTLVTGKKETFNLGKELEDTLVHPDSGDDVGFTWSSMSASEAQAKMRTEDVRAILYIPADFSKKVAQIGTDDRAKAATQELKLVTDDSVNYLTGTMAKTVALSMSQRLEERGASTITDRLLVAISTVRDGMGTAADGAGTLADGTDSLAVGLGDLASGAVTLQSGLSTLATGTQTAADGSQQLTSGLSKLSDGASSAQAGATQVSDGASKLASGTSELASQTGTLADGVSQLSAGADTLATGVAQYTAGVHQLNQGITTAGDSGVNLVDGSAAVASGLDQLKAGVSSIDTSALTQAVDGSASLKDGVTSYTGAVDSLAAMCKQTGDTSVMCQTLMGLSTKSSALVGGATALNDGLSAGTAKLSGLSTLVASVDKLDAGAHSVADGVSSVADGVAKIDSNSSSLSAGANTLKSGLNTLNSKIPALTSGVNGLDNGAQQLATGASDLTAGLGTLAAGTQTAASSSQELTDGLGKLATGAGTAASGSTQLSDGLATAEDGATKVDDGASTLADKLTEGTDKIPDVSASDRTKVSDVSGNVATVTDVRDNGVVNNGAGFTPMFMSLALWIGGIALFLVLPAIDKREKGERWLHAAVRPAVTASILAVIQAVVMMVAVNAMGQLHAANVAALCLMAILASLTYMAVNQACIAAFAFRGRFVSIILLCLQITSMGATFPIETTPKFFQWIHPFLPMSYTQLSFRKFIAGAPGVDGIVGHTIMVLLIWMIASFAVTIFATRVRVGQKPLPDDYALAPTAA